MKTEIETIELMSPAKLFKPKFMPTLLKAIEVEVSSNVPNVDTPEGRKAITSLAYKVARSKTTIDDLGKNHVAGIKQEAAAVDAIRKLARDFLDDLKVKVRAPLTTWEDAEVERVEKILGKINRISDLGDITDDIGKLLGSEDLEANLADLRKVKVTKIFAEFQDDAINKLNAAIVAVTDAVPIAKAAEREAADALAAAEKLQDEQRIENEQRIAREAVEASEGEAKRELQQRDATAAAEQADQDKRDRNTRHKGQVNRSAADAIEYVLSQHGDIPPADAAKLIIKSIVKGQIPAVHITY
jgi:hypothetical protein